VNGWSLYWSKDFVCLYVQRQHAGVVSFDCKQELFRQDVENAGDVRLSVQLMRLCAGEMKVFCAQAEPGMLVTRRACRASSAHSFHASAVHQSKPYLPQSPSDSSQSSGPRA
jgi:Golgi apparatus protein 1